MTIREPNYAAGLARFPGLTWRGLASRLDVKDCRRLELRLPAPPGRRKSGGNANRDTGGPGG